MKYSCALQFEGCFETTIGYRGVCSKCYKELVRLGIICDGDRFKDFPFWLQEMVRWEAASDTAEVRHPTKEYSEELDEKGSPTKQFLGNGGFKLRVLAVPD